jgi:hypothetical protein
MARALERRDLLKLAGIGGVVYASSLLRGLTGCAANTSNTPGKNAAGAAPKSGVARGASADFFFLQISDTHWGFSGAAVNPNSDVELKNVVAAINSVSMKPDFVVFTGDLTHTTDDADQRRKRMSEFKQIVAGLDVPMVKFMPGEHDAAPDAGAAYQEFFGDLHYAFDHQGIHFIALDNVSDPMAMIGEAQLSWLQADLKSLDAETPIVVFTHRPLWDLRPDWDWTTADGAKALDLLSPYHNVTVFFGHIHQELHHMTGHIAHHAARSLMFALPSPDSPGMRAPIPWDPQHPEQGLGYRNVEATREPDRFQLTELPVPSTQDTKP